MIIHAQFASFQELGFATKGRTLYCYVIILNETKQSADRQSGVFFE